MNLINFHTRFKIRAGVFFIYFIMLSQENRFIAEPIREEIMREGSIYGFI